MLLSHNLTFIEGLIHSREVVNQTRILFSSLKKRAVVRQFQFRPRSGFMALKNLE
jgi:hypothetical protein